MKKFIKIIWNNLKIIAGFVLILATFYYGYNYLNPLFRTQDVDYGDSFHSLPKDSMDVIVLGSSHAQYSFVPSFFYEDTGLYSYVLGTPLQPLSVSYEMLREALKTQSPKVVLLEIYTATFSSELIDDYAYVLSEYQMTGEEKKEVIDMLPEEKALTYKNEFLTNHNNWKDISSIDDLLSNHYSKDLTFGYVFKNTDLPLSNTWGMNIYNEEVDISLEEVNLIALNNIYDLCKKNNIDLLLYMAPMQDITNEAQSLRKQVWNWANEKEVKYIDFVELASSLGYRNNAHNDGAHSTISGASIITNYLSNFIAQNYVIDDHINNDELNIDYNSYLSWYTIAALNAEVDPHKYLTRIANYPNTILIKYNGENIDDEINSNLNNLGINLVYGQPLFAIVKDRQVVYSSDHEFYYVLDDNEFYINSTQIIYDYNLLSESDNLSIAVFSSDYAEYTTRNISFDYGFPWEDGYNTNYGLAN